MLHKLLEVKSEMKRLVVVVAFLSSNFLWADWFCNSLEMGTEGIRIKQVYVEVIKNYCDKTVIDLSGRCHLIEFENDGSAWIKANHEDGVRIMCVESNNTNNTSGQNGVDTNNEPSWVSRVLIEFGNNVPHLRR